MMKKFLLLAAVAGMVLVFSGCASYQTPRKMLSEDIEILSVFAPEISVLKDKRYRTNSQEKYLAAKKLAEGVDFSLTRSVEYGDEIAFYYNYQNHFVRFRFWRTKNMITESEVRIK